MASAIFRNLPDPHFLYQQNEETGLDVVFISILNNSPVLSIMLGVSHVFPFAPHHAARQQILLATLQSFP